MRNVERISGSAFFPSGNLSGASRSTPPSASISDAQERQKRLASVIAQEIIPRLIQIHHEVLKPCACEPFAPTHAEIEELALLVLGPDMQAAHTYMQRVKRRGLSLHVLFTELLEPAARHLGRMWDEDRCDFLDVTLGVARLQELLAVFNDTHSIPAMGDMRRVVTLTAPGEQHRFGLAVVEKFMRAAGWHVRSEAGASLETVIKAVHAEWFAVAGISLSCDSRLDVIEDTIKAIRQHSCNPSITIMVGGAAFKDAPHHAKTVGADGAADSAATAVLLAQKLLDQSLTRRAYSVA
jgi:methanogenic corrinoid protein MtbC1